MKRILPFLLSLLLITALVGCGGAKSPMGGEAFYDDSYVAQNGWEEENSAVSTENNVQPVNGKMVYRASIELETLEFDAAMESINTLVSDASGYFQEQDVSSLSSGYRYARLVVRIPSDQFAVFCHQVGNVCHTVRMNTTQENISEDYYDTESRLSTAKTKLARLQELLSRAESLEDIITIESAISETEQTIDRLSGTLRGYDSLVDYATVSIDLDEVYRISGTGDAPLTLGEKLRGAFASGLTSIGDFFEGLLVFLAYAWFWLLLVALVIFIAVRMLRRKKRPERRAMKGKNASDAETDPPAEG